MSVEVVMPQMGESIAEGTITRWLKKVGDHVDRDEPLFEISTDKVDAEIPSPAAGILTEIKYPEGTTVEVNIVVAMLDGSDGAAAPAAAPAQPAAEAESQKAMASDVPQPVPAPVAPAPTAPTPTAAPATVATAPIPSANGDQSVEELRRTRSSPLVRNIAREHNVNLSQVPGTGMSGRVTKTDILGFIESGAALSPAQAHVPIGASAPAMASLPAPKPGIGDRVEPMTAIRKKIADHMIMSRRTSAHVSTVYEIDMTNVVKLRDRNKAQFLASNGTKLTYMPFIFQAVNAAIRKFPIFNAQVSGDQIIYKQDINLGMAVSLDWGLIVPVIKRADDLSLAGLAKAANDLADRARNKQLKPDDVAGGTFTITNPGVYGGLFGTPIINQPQVAILGVGAIVKRPMVKTSDDGDDYTAVRSMAYFALTFDHRIIDGSDAEKFLGYLRDILEAGQFTV
ncbi:MAG: 2-oxoglutarate dehydrogenase, E2 component, dihydrolipoamide succinyltransferase [Pyrinomonadaceae bacterium]